MQNEPNLDFKKKLLGDIRDSDQHIFSQNAASKLFKCEICDYSFSQKGNLKVYVISVHENKKPFKCEICEKSYSQKMV